VVYVPFAFGYVNYASRQKEPHLRFTNVPTAGSAGALLGGAGIGVSARSKNRTAAIDYARYLCAGDYQRGDYVREGGQPGSLAAWQDDGANVFARDFFRDTLATIQASYLRPTHAGFLTFAREIAPRVAAAIAGEISAGELHGLVNRLYRDTLPAHVKMSVA
jgi:multiple sugar transport system substrate-binding protein